jgi:sRNA-binding carbon storage regulator CsrA
MSLVLSSKEHQSIVLFTGADEQIMLTVELIAFGQVESNLDAPDSVEIWWDKLLEDDNG